MTLRYHIYFLLVFLMINTSCKKQDSVINSFDDIVQIVDYEIIYSDKDIPMGIITDIEILDSILIVKQANDQYNFSFINTASKSLICQWGSIGNGPDEFASFGSGLTLSQSQIVFLEAGKKEMNYVSVAEILKKSNKIQVKKESYPYNVDFRPKQIIPINNQRIAIGAFSEGRFGVLDSNNNIVSTPFDYPFSYSEITGIYQGSVFQSKMKSSEKQNRFAISTLSSDIFEIYEVSEVDVKQIFISPFQHLPRIWKKGNRHTVDYKKSIAGLLSMTASDDLIGFMYSEQTYEEASKSDGSSAEILCFDWNGKKVRKYILPFPVNRFCIDKQYIYGVRYENDISVIYRFAL